MPTRVLERAVSKRNDVPVKLDAEVVRVAKIVASYKEKSLAEYLSGVLSPIVEKDLGEEQARYQSTKAKPRTPKS